MTTLIRTTFLAALLLTFSAGGAAAEAPWHGHVPHGAPGMHGDRQPSPEMMARLDEMRGRMLREKVGLDEARAAKVEAMLRANHTRARQLHEDVGDNHRALDELLAQDSNDADAYRVSLDALLSARRQLRSLHDVHMDALQKILTPKEQAKLLIVMHKVRRHVRKGRFGRRHHGGQGQKDPHWKPPARGQGRAGEAPPGD